MFYFNQLFFIITNKNRKRSIIKFTKPIQKLPALPIQPNKFAKN